MKIVWERIWEKSFIWNILQVFKVIFEVNVYSIYLFLEFFKIGNRFFSLAPAFLPWDSQETLRHLRQPYGPGQWMPLCWRHMWWKDRLPGGEPEAKQKQGSFSTVERGGIRDMKVVKEQADNYSWGHSDICSLGSLLKPCWYLSALLSWPAPRRVPHINIGSGVSIGGSDWPTQLPLRPDPRPWVDPP